MRLLASAVAALCLPAGAALAGDPPPAPFSVAVLERDFTQMMAWFPGEWDNAEQVYFAAGLGYPDGSAPGRIHSIFKSVDLPWLGPHVFYVQQHSDNDPAKVYRQRLYSFSADPEKMAVRLDIFTPKSPEDLLNAHLDPSRLDALTRDALEARPGCEVWWRRQAEQFIGWMKDGACRLKARDGRTITIDDDLMLSRDQLWIADRAIDETGAVVFGNPQSIPHQLRRSTAFTCWIAVPRQAPGEGWFYARNLAIHDQGGEVWVTTDEAAPRTFGFRMRNVRWPSGPNADALTLYVHAERGAPAISYAWASPEATRIGINLRTLQGSCSR